MKMRNGRLAALLLAMVMILSFSVTPLFAAGDQTFKDVLESDWYHGYIMMLYEKGIVNGYGTSGEFRPGNKLTREQASKMVALAAGLAHEGLKANFPDVDKDGWASPYIAALKDKGAIQGFPDGTFRPLANIQRGHAAKIVALAFGLREGDMVSALTDLPQDVDVKTAIETLESNGIVKGYSDTNLFKPKEEINRAEFSKILCIAMVVASIQKAEADPTPENIAAAQALANQLPKEQDIPTRDYLQDRLDKLEEEEGEPPEGPVDPDPVQVSAITITTTVSGQPYDGSHPLPNFEGARVTLTTATEDAEIYYTTDGSTPSKTSGEKYTEPFVVEPETTEAVTRTVKAIAIKSGYTDSTVATLDIEFEAELPQYTVTFSVVDGNGTIDAKTQNPFGWEDVNSGEKLFKGTEIVFTATPDDGYQVKEWKVDNVVVDGVTGNTHTITNLSADTTVTVEFEVLTLPLPKEKVVVIAPTGKDIANISDGEINFRGDIVVYPDGATNFDDLNFSTQTPGLGGNPDWGYVGFDIYCPADGARIVDMVKHNIQNNGVEAEEGFIHVWVPVATKESGEWKPRAITNNEWTLTWYNEDGEIIAVNTLHIHGETGQEECLKDVFFVLFDASPGGIQVILAEFAGEHEHGKISNVTVDDFELVKKGENEEEDKTIADIILTHEEEGDENDRDYIISRQNNGTFDDGIYTLQFSKPKYVETYTMGEEFEISAAKSGAKAAIKPSWEVKSVEIAGTDLPAGVSDVDFKLTIGTSYDNKTAAQSSGRTVTTYFEIPGKMGPPPEEQGEGGSPEEPGDPEELGITVYYPVWEDGALTYQSAKIGEVAFGMVGHPLSAGNIEDDGVVYIKLDADVTDTQFDFFIRLKDAAVGWDNVVYGEQKLTVSIFDSIGEDCRVMNTTQKKGYNDLGTAVGGAVDNDTIALRQDIVLEETLSINKSITLNLNGKKLSTPDATGSAAETVLQISENTTHVTIKGPGEIQAGATINYGSFNFMSGPTIILKSQAELTIKDGATIKGGNAINSNEAAPAILCWFLGKLNINNATVMGGDNIKDPTKPTGAYKNQGKAGNGIYVFQGTGEINITDSLVEGGDGLNHGYGCAYIDGGENQATGGMAIDSLNASYTCNITSSTIKGGNSDIYNAGTAIEVKEGIFIITNSTVKGGSSFATCDEKYGIGGTAIAIGTSSNVGTVNISSSEITGGAGGDSFLGYGIEYKEVASTLSVNNSIISGGGVNGSGTGQGNALWIIGKNTDQFSKITLVNSLFKINTEPGKVYGDLAIYKNSGLKDLLDKLVGVDGYMINESEGSVLIGQYLSDESLLDRVNASQLRITDDNQATDTIGDLLVNYFGLGATGDSLTEIVSLFWFKKYDYLNKFTFESIQAVRDALDSTVAEYEKIIKTFQGVDGGYATNGEAVESYLNSALRLAKTSSSFNESTWLEKEIQELAGLATKITLDTDQNKVVIASDLLSAINSIQEDEAITTMLGFFTKLQETVILGRVNASQLRITEANQATDTIGDLLVDYFGLDATGDSLTEIVSLFWFNNYHYQDKFTFESIQAVRDALDSTVAEYEKIIKTFQGTEGYATNGDAVESYLNSALRLAKTSLSFDENTWLGKEIQELAGLATKITLDTDQNKVVIDSDLLSAINSIQKDETITTMLEFFTKLQG